MKSLIKAIIPKIFWNFLRDSKINWLRYIAHLSRLYIKKKISTTEKIDVLFFVLHHSVWKLDSVYKIIEKDARFNPVIIICPYIAYGENIMKTEMEQSYRFFFNKGYNVRKSYDNGWLDINDEYKNKVIFFANPHNITKKDYLWSNYKDTIKLYVPYHHQIDAGQWSSQWNSAFHMAMDFLFYIDSYHLELAKNITLNKGANVVVTGYPATENLITKKLVNKNDPWKIQNKKKLRVIFAPHHTIEYDPNLGINEFINISGKMIEIAKRYEDKIQFAFKPHPILKQKLINHPLWGEKKVNEYYSFWENNSNTQLELSDYNDLFITSDAMIHDSGSFLAEYLYVDKPVMYLYNKTTESRFNDYGLECLSCCHIDKENKIEHFIELLIDGVDLKKDKRQIFIKERLLRNTDSKPSLNIYSKLCERLFNEH